MYKVIKTNLDGCLELIPNIYEDHRGTTIKPFHFDDFESIGIYNTFKEDLIVTSKQGALRGLHFQNPPYSQSKLVCCIKGRIMDVVLDIRKGSPSYGKYELFDLSNHNNHILYIPEGFAHGYLALENESIVMYKMSSVYNPKYEGGIRWDSLGIPWQIQDPIISERDKKFLSFNEFKSEFIYVP